MDSLTQIVLGAAVAEASLGRKVGNRAMIWGAIAGTIPDLDVLSGSFLSPIDALVFHRGPTHSLFTCVLMAFLMGWAVHKMYSWDKHRWIGMTGWFLLTLGVILAIVVNTGFMWTGIVSGAMFVAGTTYLIYRRYGRDGYETPLATRKEWIVMFLWSFVTHPILDTFTTYGTTIFWPVSDIRVAFNNIAVADPLYTLPFLTALLIASFYPRWSYRRRFWNYAGIIVSSVYMLLTLYNKSRIDGIFRQSLLTQGIETTHYMTSPTILNNVLWSGVAETDTSFWYGMYSFFDETPEFYLKELPKSTPDTTGFLTRDRTLKKLIWFSNGFYDIRPVNEDMWGYYDLRFGTFRARKTDPDEYVFKFNLRKEENGSFTMVDQGDRPRDADLKEAFTLLWRRIRGQTS
jgi:inner membrane protein